jgi:hypothetical protein
MLADVRSRPTPAPTRVTRWIREARRRFFALAETDWFERLVVVVFALWALATVFEIVALIVLAKFGLPAQEVFRVRHPIANHGLGNGEHDFIQWLSFAASLVASAFVVVGLVDARKGLRPRMFAMFERALLVSIFFTQVFAFVHSQFFAVFGFFVDLVLFAVVRAILVRELREERLERARKLNTRATTPVPA